MRSGLGLAAAAVLIVLAAWSGGRQGTDDRAMSLAREMAPGFEPWLRLPWPVDEDRVIPGLVLQGTVGALVFAGACTWLGRARRNGR